MTTINLYNKDCMEFMANKQENAYDLAIVDPPYGINADDKNSKKELKSKKSASLSLSYGEQKWDSKIPSREYFIDLKGISKNQIIWGANYFGLQGGMIYWKKNVTMPTYSDGELAYCSLINSVKEFEFSWHGMIQGDMKNKELRQHPTQKPVALYKWLLQNYAKKGDKIFDTHGGSMSIAIACIDLGFDLDICELDKDYFEEAVKRIQRHCDQLDMFIEQPTINVYR